MNTQLLALNEQFLLLGDSICAARKRMINLTGLARELAEIEVLILQQRQQTIYSQVAMAA